jgi:hypothetical protein
MEWTAPLESLVHGFISKGATPWAFELTAKMELTYDRSYHAPDVDSVPLPINIGHTRDKHVQNIHRLTVCKCCF